MKYQMAYTRNLGWITQEEQNCLKSKKVAIAGCGGIGGTHAEALVRLGIEHFSLSDPDTFQIENINRQVGAGVSTFGRNKAEVVAELIKEINPKAKVDVCTKGITLANINDFLKDADVAIDGIDFFNIDDRRLLFQFSQINNIPATTCAPLGTGAAMISFNPQGMTFEEYFRFENFVYPEQLCRQIVGIQPSLMSRKYVVDLNYFNPHSGVSPSLSIGCKTATALQVTQILKILLNRPEIKWAPYNIHFDPYLFKLVHRKLRWGNAGWLQQIKLIYARKKLNHWFLNK